MPTRPTTSAAPCVRAFRSGEFEELHAIERSSQPSAWSREELARILWRARTECWVVDVGGEVAAFAVLLDEGWQWHLGNLAVAPRFRRQGLAQLLLRDLDGRVATRAHPRIVLHVRETNLAAQLLYRKAGYRAVEILPRYYPDEPAYRMEKDLSPGPRV